MANTLNLGTDGNWGVKKDSLLAYNSENGNFKPLPFDFTRASSATVVNKAGLIETVGSGEPRIDFSNDAKGALKLEPQRSNLYAYSEDFSNADWTKSSATVAITSNVSPDGTTNSVYNLTGTNANLYTGGTTGVEYTVSVYAKSNGQGKDNFKLRLGNSISSSITVTDEWVRYEFTGTPTTNVFGLTVDGSPNNEWDILIWGAQLEQGSYATSYIPTQGSAVTRSADVCNNGGNEQVINSTEGVLYAEISALTEDSGDSRRLTISDGTTNNRVSFELDETESLIKLFFTGNGSLNQLTTTVNVSENFKIAASYNSSSLKLYVNGIKEGEDTSITLPIGLDNLSFDSGTGSSDFYGNVKDVRVYNTALTDQELINLTTI